MSKNESISNENLTKGSRILVVDDNPENLDLLSSILIDDGYEVKLTTSGEFALKTVKEDPPEIIILDIRMPGMNGYEVCRRLKSDPDSAGIPVIFISGLGDASDKVNAFEAGGVDYITKPFQPEEVLARLKIHLSLTRMQQNLENMVEARTGELLEKTKMLEDEIAERKKAEEIIRESLKEKDILIKEIHHRVKNNMQVISSLLELQSDYIINNKDREYFQDSQNRIRSMALVHEKLYQSNDLVQIDFNDFIQTITDELMQIYNPLNSSILIRKDVKDINIDINQAVPCGLIINELISNSLKYAFTGKASGNINILFGKEDDTYSLTVKDNGIGLPVDFTLDNPKTLGIQLVQALTNQLNGTLEVTGNKGTAFIITFPRNVKDK